MKLSEALDAYLVAKSEYQRLLDQRPQNRVLITHAGDKMQQAADMLNELFTNTKAQLPHGVTTVVSVAPAPLDPAAADKLVAQKIQSFLDEGVTPAEFGTYVGLSEATVRRLLDTQDGMTNTMETARKLMRALRMCACCGQPLSPSLDEDYE
jgi:hypothetical protein